MRSNFEMSFSENFKQIPKSYIREILEVAGRENMISFAGGLPSPDFFPVKELKRSAASVFKIHGKVMLQYAGSQGYEPLREWIAQRYSRMFNFDFDPSCIVITNGSQQTIDIVSKLFLNKGDAVLLEKPTYLGGIQALSAYSPRFVPIRMMADGPDIIHFEECCKNNSPKLFYSIPNYQNPSGICYSEEKRISIASLIEKHNFVMLEDDPYSELRFNGSAQKPIFCRASSNVCWTGSFSKMIAPGLRLGWVVLPKNLVAPFIRAKQSTDLHTNNLSQYLAYTYLYENDIDTHLEKVRKAYKTQCESMIFSIKKHMGNLVAYVEPQGGMFLWLTLPESIDANVLAQQCLKKGVAIVPGNSFFTNGEGNRQVRLNFSNSSVDTIEKGIRIIAREIKSFYSS